MSHRHEIQFTILERQRARDPEQRGGRGNEGRHWVFLKPNNHRALSREQRIRFGKRQATELVVHAVVHVARERHAIEHHAFGAAPHLDAAEQDGARVGTGVGLVVHFQPVHVCRMLRRVQVLAGCGINGVVAGIALHYQSGVAPCKWLERREDDEVIANDAATTGRSPCGCTGQRRRTHHGCGTARRGAVVRIGGTRPQAVFEIEARGVHRLRESEHLEECCITAGGRFFLLTGTAHDAKRGGASHQFVTANPVHRAYFSAKCRSAGHHVGIGDEVCGLVGARALHIGRAARGRVDRVAPVDAHRVRRDEPFICLAQRAHEREPQLRRIEVVVHAFAQHIVRLAALARIANEPKAWAVGVLRLCAELHAVQHHATRTERVRQ